MYQFDNLLVFKNDESREEFHLLADTNISILQKMFDSSIGQDHKNFLISFANAVWKLEKYCHSLAMVPVESTFSPNYDIYVVIGMTLLKHIVNDAVTIRTIIMKGLETNILWPRFAYLMLSELERNNGDLKSAYIWAQKAHADYAHCGASYRMHYERWLDCKKAGIAVDETFPLPEALAGRFCPYPFEYLAVRNNGEKISMTPCCTSLWMSYAKSYPQAKLQDGDLADVDFWNSAEFQEIRRSILDGDFKYCSKLRCPHIKNLQHKLAIKDKNLRWAIDNNQTKLPFGPKTLVCLYDETCNLTCPSCRKKPITPTKNQLKSFDLMADKMLLPLITPDMDHILLNGSGEALASTHTMRFLNSIDFERTPNLKIHLMTNGELLAHNWHKLGSAAEHVDQLIFSFDALDPAIYSKIRRGGKLDNFLSGVKFASDLRNAGKVNNLVAVSTVYPENIHEIEKIFNFCEANAFDSMTVNKFQNWGTMEATEFLERDIWNASHTLYPTWLTIYNRLLEKAKSSRLRFASTNLI